MKIAIHNRPGSFSDRWIEYCNQNNISYKIVNCYRSDIISQLDDCYALMWHHHHSNYKDVLFAKQLIISLEQSGKKVFPNFNTCWHFDDKIGQKYLLESVNAPLVPTYAFYEKDEALSWAENMTYPKVFKLRGGAGSANVMLVKNKEEASKLIRKAFKGGFPQFDRWEYFKEKARKIRMGKEAAFIGLAKGFYCLFASSTYAKMKGNERGYVYFQDFIPNNNSDTRVIIIGDKAFAIKRLVRSNDFRASGSGFIVHDKDAIDTRCIKRAFDISDSLKFQCMTYDFIFGQDNSIRILEISYGFSQDGYTNCPGYWNKNLTFHEGAFNPYGWMVESLQAKE